MLQTLSLADNPISIRPGNFSSKYTWMIDYNKRALENKGDFAGLAKNKSWINLKTLDLSNTDMCNEDATALAKNKAWKCLKILILKDISIYDGALDIVRNTYWQSLRTVEMYDNGHNWLMMFGLRKKTEIENYKIEVQLEDEDRALYERDLDF